MLKTLATIFCIFLFLYAGEYGTIQGRVIDSYTGEPLIFADVIIEGTELAAKTNSRGEFFFPFVHAGDYLVKADCDERGYILHYYHVSLYGNQTIFLDCRLVNSAFDLLLGVETTEADVFFTGTAYKECNLTNTNFLSEPVSDLNEIIALQPGVAESDRGYHLRGGNSDEISYYVDGIAVSGTPPSLPDLPSIDRMSLVNCGTNAEYGNALSGTVDIMTKDGGARPSGHIGLISDEVFSNNALDYSYNKYDLSFGGPIAKRFRYFGSADMMMTDSYQKALYKVYSPRMDNHMFGKVSYLIPGAKGRISVSGLKARDQYVVWSPYTKGGNEFKYFKNKPMYRMKNSLVSAVIDYQVASKTMISAKLGLSNSDNCFGNRDYAWEEQNDQQWYDDYRLKAEHLIEYFIMDEAPPEVSAKHVLLDSLLPYHTECTNRDAQALRRNPYGIEGILYTYGDFPGWIYGQNNDIQTRMDISHFFSKANNLEGGLKFTAYDLRYYENQLPWFDTPFFMYYERSPRTFSFYLQDKINLRRFAWISGLRFDWLDTRTFSYIDPWLPFNNTLCNTSTLWRISPRLGLGILLTERTQLRFSYTHHYENPQFKDLYYTGDTATFHWSLEHGFNKFSNVFLYPEKTVAYEFGVEHRLSNKLSFGIGAYMKTSFDLIEFLPAVALPIPYFQLQNNGMRSINGVEFNLSAILSSLSKLQISYNLQSATAQEPLPYYHDGGDYYYPDTSNANGEMLSFPVDWDERNMVKALIEYGFPRRHAISPLQELTASIACIYHDGHPYTVEDLRGNYLSDINAVDTLPGYFTVDLKCNKIIRLRSISLTLTGQIYNLFNTKQIIEVYPTTGSPDSIGYPMPPLDQFNIVTLTSSHYTPQADHDHDGINTPVELRDEYMAAILDLYADPTNYNGPFRAQIGVAVGF